MKHILNNLSEEEKNNIREQHNGSMKVTTENFHKLIDAKLGDVKPYLNEQVASNIPEPTVYDKCVPFMFSHAIEKLISEGYDVRFLKASLGVIGRESDFGGSKRYNATALLKTLGAFLGAQTSVGPAQIKPETAKKYGLSVMDLNTSYGSIKGVYQIIKNNYGIALKNGYSNDKPSSNFNLGTGSAALDIAISAFNLGEGKITKYCKTSNPEINRPCRSAGQTVAEQLSTKKVTVTKEWVPNYLPNFKSERWDGVSISSHGYVKEVAKKMKKFSCF
jgi:hypothetical protein